MSITQLPDQKGYSDMMKRTLVKSRDSKYYVVSSGYTMDQGMETMVFGCDENGIVFSYHDYWSSHPDDHDRGIEAAKEGGFPEEDSW